LFNANSAILEYPERTTDHGQQLVNFITCSCESSAPFFVIYKAGCEPTVARRIGDRLVWVVRYSNYL